MKKTFHFLFALLHVRIKKVTLAILLLVIAGLFQQGVAQSYVINGDMYAPCGTSETVTAPFNTEEGGVTANKYFGKVLITVSGDGNSSGFLINDAFYHYYPDIVPPTPHGDYLYQLVTTIRNSVKANAGDDCAYRHIVYDVDAATIVTRPDTPAYRADHTYTFIIDMTTLAGKPTVASILRFGVDDTNYDDNGGAYTVQVTQLCCPSGGAGSIFYADADHDGYGNPLIKRHGCTQPTDYVTDNTDCNDNDASIHAPQQYYVDADHDGYGSTTTAMLCSSTPPVGYSVNNTDCNDNDANINPNTVWILDNDKDGYYIGNPVTQCTSPGTGYVIKAAQQAGDCNDNDATINSNIVWVLDNDNDGYYTGNPVTQCTSPGTGYVIKTVQQAGDCNDNDVATNPATVWVLDNDKDGYYTGNSITQCTSPGTGYIIKTTQQPGDCDDKNPGIHPGAVEVCGNSIDDNCNSKIDEAGCAVCKNATALTTTNITAYGAILNWSAVADPVQWQVEYKKISTGSKWTIITLPGYVRSVNISSLLANQRYNWNISAKCGKKWTSFCDVASFKTLSSQQANSVIAQQSLQLKNIAEDKSPDVSLYPNPTRGQFIIELHVARIINTNAKIELVNTMGQTVSQENANISNGLLQKSVSISSSLPSGVYIVKVIANNKTYLTKLVYEK
jgi:hypothetical protein